ncbi:hypothetical protein CGCTS75_v001605 [Colletotrichum tropicale]|nr:hypothetical protein CGCTS75_v001605 [Colletotrichum tropicale]
MEGFLDEAESNSTEQLWLFGLFEDPDGHSRFVITMGLSPPNLNKLQKSRFLEVRSVFHVNQMTRTMVRNRFSPLRGCDSRSRYPAGLLVFPKIDFIEPYLNHCSPESIESIWRTQPRHDVKFLQGFETLFIRGGFRALHEASDTLSEYWPSLFSNLKTMLLATCCSRTLHLP